MLRRSLLATLVLLATPAASAQITLESPSPVPGANFGRTVSGMPDVDGDGLGEIAVYEGTQNQSNDGIKVHLFSGASGAFIRTVLKPADVNGQFAIDFAGIEDLDGDGIGDLIVGSPLQTFSPGGPEERAYVMSGADGQPIRTFVHSMPYPLANFGTSVDAVPDVNGDGVDDILIGAEERFSTSMPPVLQRGQVHLFSGATGELLRVFQHPTNSNTDFTEFGRTVAGVPDVNADGHGDVLVGARRETVGGVDGVGRAFLLSGTTGALLATFNSPNPTQFGFFGGTLAALDDVNGDGRPDIAVSGVNDNRVYLFSSTTGTLLRTLDSPITSDGPGFGLFGSLAGVADANDDGFGDVLIGAPQEPGPGGVLRSGQAYVMSGADGAVLSTFDSLTPGTAGAFGGSVSSIPGIPSAYLIGAEKEGVGRAYVLTASGPIFAPAAGEIVEPGEPYTVRFEPTSGVTTIDLFLVQKSRSHTGERTLIAENIPTGGGTYEWAVPADLLSPSTFLIAVDAADPATEFRSERFRVREKWRLVHVVGTLTEPEYERFAISFNAWSFAQGAPILWPPSYWSQTTRGYDDLRFGYDPFIGPDVFYNPAHFQDSRNWEHTPWDAWVRAFGTSGTYASLDATPSGTAVINQPNPVAVESWRGTHVAVNAPTDLAAAEQSFQGVCAGISTGLLLAFQDPDRFDATFLPNTGGSATLATVPLNDEVRDAVTALQNHQFGVREQNQRDRNRVFDPVTPRDVLARIKARLESDVRDLDAYLWFGSELREFNPDGTRKWGAHAVAVLGMQRDPGRDDLFQIGVFDPNLGPKFAGFVAIDSTANAWTFDDDLFVGDTGTGLYLSKPVIEDFVPATAPWAYLLDGETLARGSVPARRAGEPVMMSVEVSGKASAVIGSGGEVRFEPGALTETLPMGYAQFPITGFASRPYSYRVPVGEYAAEVAADSVGHARLAAVRDRLTVGYERSGADEGARDLLSLTSGGLTLTGGADGEVGLMALATVGAEIRRMRADSLMMASGAAVSLAAMADTSAFRLSGPAAAATYDLILDRAVSGELRSFYHAEVPLAAGATHTVRPDWATLGDGSVTVDVDLDGDGTTDETLVLEAEAFPVASDPGTTPAAPEVLAVRSFPNPASRAMTVEVATPETGTTRVTVHDVLGREVIVLHAGPLPAGTHTFALDASPLATGVYVLRVVTPGAVVAQRATVVR